MSDAQLVAYLDAAQDRLASEAESRMDEAVEAVRIGYLAATQKGVYSKWTNRRRRGRQQVGLTGAALEAAIMGLARTNPEYVVVG